MSEIVQVEYYDKAIAMPAFRTIATADAPPDQDDIRDALLAIHDLFLEHFGDDVVFAALASPRGTGGRLVKATKKKREQCRAVIEEGLESKHGVRYYGTDETPLELPHLPFLSLGRQLETAEGTWCTVIEVAVPYDHPDVMQLAEHLDAILRKLPLMEGYQGYGWEVSPVGGLDDRWLPSTLIQRYPAALLGKFPRFLLLQYYDKYFAERFEDYDTGISDVGWRTYVGAPFVERLGDPAKAEAKGVTVEHLPNVTVVTAGPAPIWGGTEAGEDLSAMRAAFSYVKPAWATRHTLVRFTLGWDDTVPAWVKRSEGYLDRLEENT